MSDEYFLQQRGFSFEEATKEKLVEYCRNLETKNLILEQKIWGFKSRYAQFEAIYSQAESLERALESQKEAFQAVIAQLQKEQIKTNTRK